MTDEHRDYEIAERALNRFQALTTRDELASNPAPVAQRVNEFFDRPGDFYIVNLTIALDDKPLGMKYATQFAIKADQPQLEYAAEILQQLRGALGQHSRVTMTKAQQLDRLPGTTEAYAVRPPNPAPEYVGKHREPDDAPGNFPYPQVRLTDAIDWAANDAE